MIAEELKEVETKTQTEKNNSKLLDSSDEVLPPKIPKLTRDVSLNFDFSGIFEDDFDIPQPPTNTKKLLDKNYKYKVEGHNILTIEQLLTLDEQDKIGRRFVVYCYLSGENRSYLCTTYLHPNKFLYFQVLQIN